MDQIIRIGMDTSKHVFQLHGVNAAEEPVLRKKLRRQDLITFFGKLPPTVVALEACGGSHHWARLLQALGHQVKLIAPQLAKPYVKRGKNDAADAEAICEAMSRPTMRFVPVKTAEQQAALMLVGVRDRLIRQRTQLINVIRGYAAEFGLIAPKGLCRIEPLLERSRPMRPCRFWPESCLGCRLRNTRDCRFNWRRLRIASWPGTAPKRAADAWPEFPGWGRSGPPCW
jgi:transposase